MRHRLGAAERGVHHDQIADARIDQLGGHELAHLAEAGEEDAAPFERAVHVARDQERRGGDRDRMLGQGGLAAHAFGGAVGGLQDRIQGRAGRARLHGPAVALLDLPQDLGLADRLAIERGGNGEDMAQGLGSEVAKAPGAELVRLGPGLLGEQADERLGPGRRRIGHGHDLEPLASGQNHGFRHGARVPGRAQAREQGRGLDLLGEQTLAEHRARGALVDADHEKAAGGIVVRRGHDARATGNGRGARSTHPGRRPPVRPIPDRGPWRRSAPVRHRPTRRRRGPRACWPVSCVCPRCR